MQAVSNMLELVPTGVNKGSGMRKLLASLKLPTEVHSPGVQKLPMRKIYILVHAVLALATCETQWQLEQAGTWAYMPCAVCVPYHNHSVVVSFLS